MIRISVVICTYNRGKLLVDALQSLCEQSIETSEYEVVIVDNNSTDNTREVVDEFCNRLTSLRYCFEPNQGLSHARNRGWREAKGEYVAYIDDDCKVPEQWLAAAKKIIEQISPDVFGGPIFPFYNTPRPNWFKDSYCSRDKGNEARNLTDLEYLSGGNIFFRRALLEILGGFDVGLGMSGRKLAYGEETALSRRIRATMPEQVIYYDPELYVYHLVHSKNMSLHWIIRQRFATGRYSYRVFQGNNSIARARHDGLERQSLKKVLLKLLRDVRWDRARQPHFQNYLYEDVFGYLHSLGVLYERFLNVMCRTKCSIDEKR